MARGLWREQGGRPLGKTTVVQAGTRIERVGADGELDSRTLEYDTVFPVGSVGYDSLTLSGEEWSIVAEAWGWTEAGD